MQREHVQRGTRELGVAPRIWGPAIIDPWCRLDLRELSPSLAILPSSQASPTTEQTMESEHAAPVPLVAHTQDRANL